MQWRKLDRMSLVSIKEPHRRRESLIKVKSPLIANFYIASATHDRFWPRAADLECLLSRRVLEGKQTCRGHRENTVPEPISLSPAHLMPANTAIAVRIA